MIPPSFNPGPPKMFVEQRGSWGPMAWTTWVEYGLLHISGEHGTYAWTRQQAIRKGERLLRYVERHNQLKATKEQIQ